eukprot:7385976-Karenia_brevis.AAC.1
MRRRREGKLLRRLVMLAVPETEPRKSRVENELSHRRAPGADHNKVRGRDRLLGAEESGLR